MKTKRKTNNTMPPKKTRPEGRRPQFNHQDFLYSKERISGSDNVRDAIEFVGRKHCCTSGHGGVLIYGKKTSFEDYCTVLDGRTLEVSKRLYIIINSLHFHPCFFIFHIKATTWNRTDSNPRIEDLLVFKVEE